MQVYNTIAAAIAAVRLAFSFYGRKHTTESWQGVKLPVAMFEHCNVYFRAQMPQTIEFMKLLIEPDLPWCDIHFEERVGGIPLNPGESYKEWPGYKEKRNAEFNDGKFRQGGKFSHTYMERYWPKHAGQAEEARESRGNNFTNDYDNHWGIRYQYGDLKDVIELLIKEPGTRQAYLPVWFPEDTGAVHGGRVPCSLGYHFMIRDNQLHIHYGIRACDFIRHFKNDIYLTMRLAHWVLEQLKDQALGFGDVTLGVFTMDIISLHVFYKERNLI